MKKLLLIVLFLGCFGSVFAQQFREVVYLKNGSIIKGLIEEQIPNEKLSIRTSDGSLFVYKMSDVLKITKEYDEVKQSENEAERPPRFCNKALKRGYKGMFDFGYIYGSGVPNYDRLSYSTSHGFQFNPYIFLGMGVALEQYYDWESIVLDGYYGHRDPDFEHVYDVVPMFFNFRYSALNKNVTPFFDQKIGYSVGDLDGVYCQTSVGVRWGVSKKFALNLFLGYSVQCLKSSHWNEDYMEGVSFRIGFDF